MNVAAQANSRRRLTAQKPRCGWRWRVSARSGSKVAEALDRGIPGCVLAAVSANDRDRAAKRLAISDWCLSSSLGELEPYRRYRGRMRPRKVLAEIAEPFLRAGKVVDR